MNLKAPPPSDPGSASGEQQVPLLLALPTAEATFTVGAQLGRLLLPGDLIGLDGPLGAGKTSFVQGLARGLDTPAEVPVTSPTFTLINEYPGRVMLYHVDLYRLEQERELDELGLWEMAESGGVMAVEWLSRFPQALPLDRLQLDLSMAPQRHGPGRLLRATPLGPRSAERLRAWQQGRVESKDIQAKRGAR